MQLLIFNSVAQSHWVYLRLHRSAEKKERGRLIKLLERWNFCKCYLDLAFLPLNMKKNDERRTKLTTSHPLSPGFDSVSLP